MVMSLLAWILGIVITLVLIFLAAYVVNKLNSFLYSLKTTIIIIYYYFIGSFIQ